MRRILSFGVLAMLSACATPTPPPAPPAPPPSVLNAPASPLRPWPDTGQFLQCVPFARAVSGVEIRGDAWTWWDQAAGKYQRGNMPKVGAVLTLGKSQKLKLGHVAVVVSLNSPRQILVTHANWGSDGETRGVVHDRQPVIDVSPGNDWTQVRMMNRYGDMGSTYPAHGFIYPSTSHAAVN